MPNHYSLRAEKFSGLAVFLHYQPACNPPPLNLQLYAAQDDLSAYDVDATIPAAVSASSVKRSCSTVSVL